MASLRGILDTNATDFDKQLKAKLHSMEVTFLSLQFFHNITSDAVKCTCVLTSYLRAEYFTDENQVKSCSLGELNSFIFLLCLGELFFYSV